MFLSKGGRLTLIRSTLSNLLTYFMSIPIPIAVAKKLERIQRDFLWEGLGQERKLHLLNWGIVCSPMRLGGLGLRSLVLLNKVLLCKRLWQFETERGSFWCYGRGMVFSRESRLLWGESVAVYPVRVERFSG